MSRLIVRAIATLATLVAVALLTATSAGAAPDDGGSDTGASPDSAAVTWGIQPVPAANGVTRQALVYDVAPGASISDHVRILNHGAEPLTLSVSAHDAYNTADGGFDVLGSESRSIDLGSWLELETATVTVPGRGHVDVGITLAVPSNASPGDHSAGIVASMSTTVTDDGGRDVVVDHRVGVRVHARVAGPERPELVVTSLSARYSATGPVGLAGRMVVDYTVHNAGNLRVAADQRLVVAGPFGMGRRAITIDALPELLPGSTFEGTAVIDGVRPFLRSTVDLELDWRAAATSTGPPASGVVVSSASAWTVPVVVLVLLLAGVAATVARRGRRARAAPAVAAEPVVSRSASLGSVVFVALLVAAPLNADERAVDEPAVVHGVGLSPSSVAIGADVTVRLHGWPEGIAKVELCGNAATHGSTDCDLTGSVAVRVDSTGTAAATVAARPPVPCPCVIRVHQRNSGASTITPIEIGGAPIAPPVPVAARPGDARRLEIVSVAVEPDESWGALLGLAPGRRATIVIRNAGTARIDAAVVELHLESPTSGTSVVPSPDPLTLEAGEERELEVAFALPTPAIGGHHLDVRVHGGDEMVRHSVPSHHLPWGLVNGVAVAALALVTVRARRSHTHHLRPGALS